MFFFFLEENIENLFKHKIFFTQQREDCDYGEGGKVKWSGIYKSYTIDDHKKIGVTDTDELLTQIKPFLAPLAVGQRAYVMVRCPSCVRPSVRASVRALTFSLNIFFAETTYRILMKFHRNVPTMVLFRISSNILIPSKTLVVMATKLKIF